MDDQIKKLDDQLVKYKEQIKKTRPGPAQEAIKRRALQVRGRRGTSMRHTGLVGATGHLCLDQWLSGR